MGTQTKKPYILTDGEVIYASAHMTDDELFVARQKVYAEYGWDRQWIEWTAGDWEDTEQDPVHEDGGQWWFWDETWAYRHGPFPTKAVADAELARYIEYLDGDQE